MSDLNRRFVTELLKDDIIGQVNSGELQAGDSILSLNALKDKYGISKGSVEKAVKELMADNYLVSRPGKGYFVKGRERKPAEGKLKHIGLTYAISPERLPLIRKLEDYVMSKGGLLTVYNVSEDKQDPLKEKAFLEKMEHFGASGVAVFASPIEPYNSNLYQDLRDKGMKVALITPHQYDVSNEVCYLRNQRLAGQIVVQKAVSKGYRHIIYQVEELPFGDWLREGICYEARKQGITCDALPKVGDIASVLQDVQAKTAFMLTDSNLCAQVIGAVKKSGMVLTEKIGVCSLVECKHDPLISCTKFPEERLLFEAIDYLLDASINSNLPIQRWFKPRFIDYKTL